MRAEEIAHAHAGVIAWSRDANPSIGEFGPPEVLEAELLRPLPIGSLAVTIVRQGAGDAIGL